MSWSACTATKVLFCMCACTMISALTPEATADSHFYFNDFNEPVGSEWSNTTRTESPSGERFLGKLGNDTATLSLEDLPSHSSVTVGLDLYILHSWDGNGHVGPDIWSMGVVGGETLLNTTFTNVTDWRQAYPDNYPGGDNVAWTGAVAKNSLGYPPYSPGASSATYHLEYTFDHNDPDVSLFFSGSGLQQIGDESWGIDNVSLRTTELIETLTVQGRGGATVSSEPLRDGELYMLESRGTYVYSSGLPDDHGRADAEWHEFNDPETGWGWVKDYPTFPQPNDHLDLHVNGQGVEWLGLSDGRGYWPNRFSEDHAYGYYVVGNGEPVSMHISDSCDDNDESLEVALIHVASLPGDVTWDGVVDSHDLDLIRSRWGDTIEPALSRVGDANGDGIVSSPDLDLIRAGWLAGVTAVPEPSVCLLVSLGVPFFGWRWQRNR